MKQFSNFEVFFLTLLLLIIGIASLSGCQKTKQLEFTVADHPWEPALGNHRAVLQIDNPSEIIRLKLQWRRRDRDPENKRFIIIHSNTQDTIPNIARISVNNEDCDITFGPVNQKGTYYFYYLPYQPDSTYGSYMYDYYKKEAPPEDSWLEKIPIDDSISMLDIPLAKCNEIQSRTSFDSFYPMEIIPTQSEKLFFLSKLDKDYHVFTEDRRNPIRMSREIPYRWINTYDSSFFHGSANQNEYYTFQLGVYAAKKELENIQLEFSDLFNEKNIIPADAFTCFNLSGIDPKGIPFTKEIDIPHTQVQPLWIGLDVPKEIEPGIYRGSIKAIPGNTDAIKIPIQITISNKYIEDRGDSEPWKHSRLRWLNSTKGLDNDPVDPFSSIEVDDNQIISILGKTIDLYQNKFPSSIKINNKEILAAPISFDISNETFETQPLVILTEEPGLIEGTWKAESQNFDLTGVVNIEFDGYINYRIKIRSKRDIENCDFKLNIPFKRSIARYMMGMGLPGSKLPTYHIAPWEGPHDSFWIGNTKGGIHFEFRGSNYHGPLLNLYHPEYPDSWFNSGKGRMEVKKSDHQVIASISSGSRSMHKNEELEFEFSMLLTPLKEVNQNSQFTNRYYHSGGIPDPQPEDVDAGIKIINVHHANELIPYINYPFIDTKKLKAFIDDWHSKGMKVKIYYTVRELTNHLPELWALRSLGYEILQNGPGGGFPWLREHVRSNYRRQWYHPYTDGGADAALLTTTGDSRWYNYYIEGLGWLVRNLDIDGIYMDDVSFDRNILKRMRKVMAMKKPGTLIDLHSNTGFSKGPAIQYTEFFPYVDKLWFGESFQYDKMSAENWLVEVSGIPFGLMGDMLQGGGNRWLGMLFGMTVRLPWYSAEVLADPKPVWKFWDEYQIKESRMIGFWEDNCPIYTKDPDVKVTVYEDENKYIIALGNFGENSREIQLFYTSEMSNLKNIDEKKLVAPFVKDYQISTSYNLHDKILVEANKGWLLILEK